MSSKSNYFILNKIQISLIERLNFHQYSVFNERNIISTSLSSFFSTSINVSYKKNDEIDIDGFDVANIIETIIKNEMFDDLNFIENEGSETDTVKVVVYDENEDEIGYYTVSIEYIGMITIEVVFDHSLMNYISLNL